MKTGRPNHYIPSRHTVARDVKHVFQRTRKKIAKMLQVSILDTKTIKKKFNVLTSQGIDTALSFSTDAWTSPNNKAYVAITVHFEKKGLPICLLLDIVEVPCSHTGVNLAIAFAQVLEDFGIAEKVSYSNFLIKKIKSLTIQVRSLV